MNLKKITKAFVAMILSLSVVQTSFARVDVFAEGEAEPPAHQKTLTPNDDGTYTLSLDVTGKSEASVTSNKADVLIIVDKSGSMDFKVEITSEEALKRAKQGEKVYSSSNEGRTTYELTYRNGKFYLSVFPWTEYTGPFYGSETRLDVAKSSVNTLVEELLSNNSPTERDKVEVGLVSFSNQSNTKIDQTLTTSESSFDGKLNALKAGGGTNWDAALMKAQEVKYREGTDHYVIFVSDGDPTYYVDKNNKQQGNGSSTTQTEYDHAYEQAKTIVDSGADLYTIGVFGNVTGMKNLTDEAYKYNTSGKTSDGKYFSATDEAGLNKAFEAIIQNINHSFDYQKVGIKDTIGTNATIVLPNGEPTEFTYYKVVNGVETQYNPSDNPELYQTAAYNGTDRAVEWKPCGDKPLENGVTYRVKFKVWPSQEAFDQAAAEGKELQVASNSDKDGEVRVDFTAVKIDGDQTVEIPGSSNYTNPKPMTVKPSYITIEKEWDDDNNITGIRPDSITLNVLVKKDEALENNIENFKEYKTVTLKKDANGNYTTTVAVASSIPGYTSGHTYTVAEPDNKNYKFESAFIKPTIKTAETQNAAILRCENTLHEGTLSLSKTMNAYSDEAKTALKDKTYEFTVTLKDKDGNELPATASYKATVSGKETTITTGSKVTLKDGESVKITGLPFGTKYELSETEYGGFTPVWTNQTGTIGPDNIEAMATAVNEYTVKPTTATINLTKSLTGRKLEEGEFTFNLLDDSGTVVKTVTNTADGKVEFTTEYTLPGEYHYTVQEVIPAEGDRETGVTYSENVAGVLVEVTDNLEGQLVADVKFDTNTKPQFENTYHGLPVDVTLEAAKTLTGRTTAMGVGEFAFAVMEGEKTVATGTNDAEGNIKFTSISFNEAGTYDYTIVETSQDGNGITVDTTQHTAKVVVEDNLEGQLVATVTYDDGTGIPEFKNEYHAEPVKVRLNAVKSLVGRNLVNDEFTFTLGAVTEGAPLPSVTEVTNGEGGKVEFGDIVFENPGTYEYTITEKAGQLGGVTYDTEPRTITVTVEDDQEGHLVATSVKGNSPTIENTYASEAASISLKVTKNLTGRDVKAMEDGEFSFRAECNEKTVEGFSMADGSVTFPSMSFDTVGEYPFTITETSQNGKGITVDTGTITGTITVVDNGDGTKTATAKYGEKTSFDNEYTAENATITLAGTKSLTGRTLKEGEFSFTLTAVNKAPVPADTTVTNNADGSFAFGEITYDKAGTYEYEIAEVEGNLGGVKYDQSKKKVMVEVTDDGEGALHAAVKEGSDSVSFNNTYTYQNTTYTFEATKELTGRTLENGEFRFEVVEGDTVVASGSNDAKGKVTFAAINYDEAGEHDYVIREINDGKGGVTYDKNTYKAHVSVVDNGQGNLVATASGTTNPVFNNTYTVTDKDLVISGSKLLSGRALNDKEFEFELYENGNLIDTVKNTAKGTFSFSLKYTKDDVGEHKYTIKEKLGGLGGVTYDTSEKEVTVKVEDNGLGELVLTTDIPEKVEFANKYKAAKTSITIEGTKTLNGRGITEDDNFTFELKEGGKIIATATAGTDGKFSFTVDYSEAGDHTYTVTEVKGNKGGVTYSEEVKTVKVSVTDDLEGHLHAEINKKESDPVAFTNTYSSEKVNIVLEGTKTLTGRDILDGDNFTFELKEGGKTIAAATAGVDGRFSFTVEYTEVGEHTYTVTEVAGDKGGVTYSKEVKTVKVSVTDDGEGHLVATKANDSGRLEFENTYTADPVEVTLEASKKIIGRDLAKGEFEFDLMGTGENVLQTVTNDEKGKIVFAAIEYKETGTYTYTIKEKETDKGGVTIDPMGYDVTVVVTDDLNGNLVAEVTYGNDKEKPVITNTYIAKGSIVIEATKVLEGRNLNRSEFTFSIKDADGKTVATGSNDADGKIVFTPIYYEQTGDKEYSYTVIEDAGKLANVTYDTKEYPITVTTKDNGDGTIKATVDKDSATLEFKNTYTPNPTNVVLEAQKKLEGIRDLKDGEFSFEILDKDNKPVATGKNDAKGHVTFSEITYTEKGTYEYTICEVKGSAGGVEYDESKSKVTVKINDDGFGTLTPTVSYDGGKVPVFTNVYTTESASISLTAEKVLEGRPLVDGEFEFRVLENDEIKATGKNDEKGEIVFSEITYDEPGTHTYTVVEVQGSLGGIKYDETVHTVVVDVTDDKNGKLVATVSDSTPNPVVFKNTYTPAPTSIKIEGTKTLTGRKILDGDDFTFELKEGEDKITTATSGVDGKFSFTVEYTEVGEHTYTVTEVAGDKGGVTYSEEVKTVKVSVTDDGEGHLVATKANDSDRLEFKNSYAPAPVAAVIHAIKTLDGRMLNDDEFKFDLIDTNENVLQTVANNANGEVDFEAIVYSETGTYTYKIQEEKTEKGGVTIDSGSHTVNVVVTDNLQGNLEAKVTYDRSENAPEFKNTYIAEGEFTPVITKVLNGRVMNDDEFKFEVVDGNGVVVSTGTNAKDGAVTFSPIKYVQTGDWDYTYTVREKDTHVTHVEYDTTEYTIKVHTTDNLDGTITAELAEPTAETRVFTNTYTPDPVNVTLEAQKELEGIRVLKDEEFSFEILDKDNKPVATGKNDENGHVTFSEITYTEKGTYEYTVREVKGSAGGVEYDESKSKVTVTIYDDGKGTLTPEVKYEDGEAHVFKNVYTAKGTSAIFSGIKVMTGRELNAGEFKFEVLKDNEVLATAVNDADGNFAFDEITYNMPGVYTYTIREVKGDLKGVTYDESEHIVTVTVTDDENGNLENVVEGLEGVVFHNSYKAKAGEITLFGKKELNGRELKNDEFTFEMLDKDGKVVSTAKNAKNGEFTFTLSGFTAEDAGEHIYTIREVKGKDKDVAYDTHSVEIRVTVKDDLNGQITVTASHDVIKFVNTVESPKTGVSNGSAGWGMSVIVSLTAALFLLKRRTVA